MHKGVHVNSKGFTISARQTKTDTCENSIDLDETAHNGSSHQDLHSLVFCF